jgi:alpha/beta superfamily hydrolase
MLLPKNSRQIFIPGPVGQLDCLELSPINTIIGTAIIFHPDPKGGGNYTNKIVQTLAKVLTQKGYLCYCPNLRGVGLSDGTHDFGKGEIEDAKALHAHLQKQYSELPLILAGFSFGTAIASILAASVTYQKLILIAPAVTRYEVNIHDSEKTIVVHGDEDDVIEFAAVLAWSKKYNQPIICFPNTGHFFHGKLLQLQNVLNSLLNM